MNDREAFEAWAMKFNPQLLIQFGNGDTLHCQFAWAVWQAATQRQQERIAELEAQVQALSLDAGRYRFIRDNCNRRINIEIDNAGMEISDTVDASIDAAIAAGKVEG